MTSPQRPPFEATTAAVLRYRKGSGELTELVADQLTQRDSAADAATEQAERDFLLDSFDITLSDQIISGPAGELTVAIARPNSGRVGPTVLFLHGGGLVLGSRFSGVERILPIIERHGGAVVSVEYRLAPQHRAPAAFDDAYAGLLWAAEHAETLGGESNQLLVAGPSAGGNLALAVALASRDRNGPKILGVLAAYPMLDDRNDSISVRQFWRDGSWSGHDNQLAWDAVLGARRGGSDVSSYEAPARAQWLGGLPPIFLDVASAEPFRDEVVDFANRIWRDGGDAELHVFPGGTHVHEEYSAHSWIGRGVRRTREEWVAHLLAPDDPQLTLDYVKSLEEQSSGGEK